jgi:hypothetical protein
MFTLNVAAYKLIRLPHLLAPTHEYVARRGLHLAKLGINE